MLLKLSISLCLWFLANLNSFAQVDTIGLPPNLNDIEWQLPLLNKALIADTIPIELGFNQVQKIGFQLYEKDSVFIRDDKCAWLHFQVKNPHPTDTLVYFVSFNKRIHKVYLFSQVGQTIDSIAGGELTDYYKRPFQDNKACYKLELPPQYLGTYWLKFNSFSENRSNLNAQLVSVKAELKERITEQSNKIANYTFEVIYLSLFVILSLFAARMAYIWLDEGYKWYAIYIGLIGLFYFRDLENYNNKPIIFFSYFSSWHFEIEPTICYLTYIAYMIFFQKFLDMKQFYPHFNRQYTIAIRILMGCLIVDLLIHLIWGLSVSFPIFVYVRLVFFLFYFIILFQIAFGTSSSLSRFVIFGTFCMLVPGITSIVAMAFGGDTSLFGYGLFWLYEFPHFKLPMYGTRLGVLLEAFCFIFGLSWKAKREYNQLKGLLLKQDIRLNNEKITESNRPLSSEAVEQDEQQNISEVDSLNSNEPLPEETIKKDVPRDDRIVHALAQLENEYRKPDFNVKKWAQMVHLSPKHFSKLIIYETQEPPSTHIQRLRLKYAQQLMLMTDLPLAEIASESGYNDSNYFSRIFKKTFQLTPSEWQKLHKKG